MVNNFFFWVFALIFLVQSPFIFAEDLCENVSQDYKELCLEIESLDISELDKLEIIQNINETEQYTPIPRERFQEDFCLNNNCLLPEDISYKFNEEKLDSFMQFGILVGISSSLFVIIKHYGDKIWQIVDS
jgi:hypothetical protein